MRFFDLHINGYAGCDFNRDDLTVDQLHHACQRLRDDHVEGILATIVTEDISIMCRRLQQLVNLREQDPLIRELIRGFHIEGPYLSPAQGYRGAHPLNAIRPPCQDSARRLLDACDGLVKIVTLAPECDAKHWATRYFTDHGVIVAAGHSDASLDQLKSAINAGLSMFTHLGNGCPTVYHRHDNIVQRVLSLGDSLWHCFIADGIHIPYFALQNYLRLVGFDRSIIVTDAVAPAGAGAGRFTVSRWSLDVDDDLVVRSADHDHFIGSAVHFPRVSENLKTNLSIPHDVIERLVYANPQRAITCRAA